MISLRKLKPWLLLIMVVATYLVLRLPFYSSFTFEYDMPRVARVVQRYLEEGSFITAQEYYEPSHWNNVPWGPALVWYYAPFFLASPEPWVIAQLVTIFNVISVVAIFFLGWKFFSLRIGFFAGLLLATHPLWVFFSRLIYQPTPVVPFIALSMFCFYAALFSNKKWAFIALPISWAILLQLYLPTAPFLATSGLILLINFRKIQWGQLLAGAGVAGLLFIPSIRYYRTNPEQFQRFFETPSQFTPPQHSVFERVLAVFEHYGNTIGGDNFHYYLDYAQADFDTRYPLLYWLVRLGVLTTIGFILVALVRLLKLRLPLNDLTLLLWTIAPLWFFLVFWTSELTLRYFLPALPPLTLLIARMSVSLKDRKIPLLPLLAVGLVVSVWTSYTFGLHHFLASYQYPQGRLGDLYETPYFAMKQAFEWMKQDGMTNGYDGYRISSNSFQPLHYEEQLLSVEYLQNYVYKLPKTGLRNGNYLITYTTLETLNRDHYPHAVFGPVIVLRLSDL